MRALYTSLYTRKPVACTFERRTGLTVDSANVLLEEMRGNLDPCAYEQALMRTYYPDITVQVGDKSHPGLQVVDMLLWSMGQEIFFPGGQKAKWAERCGLFKWSDAAIPEEPMRWVRCKVNCRDPMFAEEPDHVVLGHLKLTLCGHQELTHPPGDAASVATRN